MNVGGVYEDYITNKDDSKECINYNINLTVYFYNELLDYDYENITGSLKYHILKTNK